MCVEGRSCERPESDHKIFDRWASDGERQMLFTTLGKLCQLLQWAWAGEGMKKELLGPWERSVLEESHAVKG